MYGNGWDWDIGTPMHLTDAATYLRAYIDPTQLAEISASVKAFPRDLAGATGANYTDSATIDIKLAALENDGATISAVLALIGPSLEYRTDGDGSYGSRDGIHPDGSFIQHDRIAYTGTYGVVYLTGMAQLNALMIGTPWEITDPDFENVFVTADKGFVPMTWNGLMMDSVRGRAISRESEPDAADGLACAFALSVLAETDTDAARAAKFRSAAKGWVLHADSYPYQENLGLASLAVLVPLTRDPAVPEGSESESHNVFPDMDRAIHRREGWAASLAMTSERIAYYESINQENLHGWHTGEGMLQIYLEGDSAQFNDNFWNTVDSGKLPGTLAHTVPLADAYGSGYTSGEAWVGGSVLDERYGASGMALKALGAPLQAKRSWFFLDDAVVGLSAGITATAVEGAWVNSVIENRRLPDPEAAFLIDGENVIPTVGMNGTFNGNWAHLEGSGGYLFLDGEPVKAYRVSRTGAWQDINGDGNPAVVSRTYMQLFRDYGSTPQNADHAYAILPNATPDETAGLAASGDIHVVENSAAVQSVLDARTQVTMANFWQAGTAGSVQVSDACSVVLQQTSDELRVAVSDPSRTVNEVTLTIATPGMRYSISRNRFARMRARVDQVQLVFDLEGLRGGTRQIVLPGAPRRR